MLRVNKVLGKSKNDLFKVLNKEHFKFIVLQLNTKRLDQSF